TFKPFELYKGFGTKGTIFRFPVIHVTYDILIRHNKFPDNYGQKSRTWAVSQLSRQFEVTKKIEKSIDPKYWSELATNDKLGYTKLMREGRIGLTKQGLYDQKMMRILKKVRCSQEPTNFECNLTGE
ncbi:MAG TPA: putative solute-binding protein, partial [Aquirhabdus sp.]